MRGNMKRQNQGAVVVFRFVMLSYNCYKQNNTDFNSISKTPPVKGYQNYTITSASCSSCSTSQMEKLIHHFIFTFLSFLFLCALFLSGLTFLQHNHCIFKIHLKRYLSTTSLNKHACQSI